MFANRQDAGRQLAETVAERSFEDPIVYALPRGGVPVAAPVAARLGAPLEIILVQKLGAPGQPELAIGAVVDGANATVVLHHDIVRELRISSGYIAAVTERAISEIERRRREYVAGREPISPRGHTAIVVDDGIATGATAEAALRSLRKQGPRRLVLAVPVAAEDTVGGFPAVADEVICLHMPVPFWSVGSHYTDFGQVSDTEVRQILTRAIGAPGT